LSLFAVVSPDPVTAQVMNAFQFMTNPLVALIYQAQE
jgi:hypothetical protein